MRSALLDEEEELNVPNEWYAEQCKRMSKFIQKTVRRISHLRRRQSSRI